MLLRITKALTKQEAIKPRSYKISLLQQLNKFSAPKRQLTLAHNRQIKMMRRMVVFYFVILYILWQRYTPLVETQTAAKIGAMLPTPAEN